MLFDGTKLLNAIKCIGATVLYDYAYGFTSLTCIINCRIFEGLTEYSIYPIANGDSKSDEIILRGT